MVSGGIGNLIDRIIRGYVVDFLQTDFMDFPIFNVADCFVVIGAILLFIYFVFFYSDTSVKPEETEVSSDNADHAGECGDET